MSDYSRKMQLLIDIDSLNVSTDIKADILRDIARTFPETSEIRKRLDTFNPNDPGAAQTLLDLIKAMILLLPLYSPPPAVDAQERQKDIETEVRLSLNEKFTKSPYFLFMSAILAACITLFSLGLVSLNKDVKSADELVNKMTQQVTSSAVAMNTMTATQEAAMAKMTATQETEMAKSRLEFNNRIQAAETLVTDAEKSVTATIDSKFKEELEEVRRTKKETIEAIVGQLNQDAKKSRAALETAESDNLVKINQHGTELYYKLQKPTWKDLLLVGIKINWPLWVVSLLGLILAVVALIRSKG